MSFKMPSEELDYILAHDPELCRQLSRLRSMMPAGAQYVDHIAWYSVTGGSMVKRDIATCIIAAELGDLDFLECTFPVLRMPERIHQQEQVYAYKPVTSYTSVLRPVHLAARIGGHPKMIKWLAGVDPLGTLDPEPRYYRCRAATEMGNLDVLKRLRKSEELLADLVCEIATGNGNLDVLNWLRETGDLDARLACLVSIQTDQPEVFRWLAQGGLDLEFARQCPEPSPYADHAMVFDIEQWIQSLGKN